MLIYEKVVNGVKHLFGNYSGNVPTDSDPQLTYKDYDGDVITPVTGDSYSTTSADGKAYITRKSDGKDVNVFIGDHCVIGEVHTPKVVKSIKVKTAPTKVSYTTGETLTMAGLVITATYADGDKVDINYGTEGITYSPAEGTAVTESGNVTITYSGKTCKQAITFA